MSSLINKIQELSRQNFAEVISIRRHIHQHPELSFHEFETSKYICNLLDNWKIEYKSGFVKTGIVGHIKGKNPDKKVIALRADIDALPIQEKTGLEFQSKNNGVMHACGHDVHSSSLLGAIKILNELKDEFEGTVKFIFQPGEEKLPGGASLMIKEKALENPKAEKIIGQHVYPELTVGKVGFKNGNYMASTDELYFTVKGKGGHAALPHTYNNPIFIAGEIVKKLNEYFMLNQAKNIPNEIPTVIAFGKFIANGATNVIPNEVSIEGTFRTFNEDWRAKAHQKIKEIATETAKNFNGECEVNIMKGYPFLINDEATTELSKQSAVEYLGEENVVDLELRMTAEDFAYYSQIMPGCFYRLGITSPENQNASGLHTSTFIVDENALEIGAGLMAYIAIKQLSN